MHRRRFLLTPPRPLVIDDEPIADYSLVRVSRQAMATRFEIALPFGTPDAVAAAEDALDLIDDLEDQLTIYREHSEVSQLNATAFEQPVTVEPRLFKLLQFSALLSQRTHGAFDIATGSLSKTWGFFRREGRVPTNAEFGEALKSSGLRHVILDAERSTVRFRRRGLELNLGSIGKGYALDRAGELLKDQWGIRSALLHGGGSSVLALGSPPNDRRGWPVALRHPRESRSLGTVRLRNAALGTTASTYQHFEYNGKQYGHLLDPRTGWPADAVASASAVAATAAEADALATAYFVLGIEATRWLDPVAVILPDTTSVVPVVLGATSLDYTPPSPETQPSFHEA